MLSFIVLQVVIQGFASAATISVSRYAPVPTTAAGPIPTPPGYRLQSFGDGAYMVTDGGYQNLFFVASESVVVVDAPPTIGENVLHAIRNVTTKPISHVVYSHHHADHIGGAYLYGTASDIDFIAHRLTAEELALTPDKHRPAPTITFESSYTLNVGNQTLQLDYRGPNHDPGNIFIYAPTQKILALIDIVYPGWLPFNDLGEAQNVPGYMKAHDQLLAYDFNHYVGGHLDKAGTREDVITSRNYVHDLFNTSVRAIKMSAGTNNSLSVSSTIEPAVEKVDPHDFWALVHVYMDTLTDYVAKDLAPRWSDKLYGTDVYGKSNANTMIEALRLDWGMLGPFGVTNA